MGVGVGVGHRVKGRKVEVGVGVGRDMIVKGCDGFGICENGDSE